MSSVSTDPQLDQKVAKVASNLTVVFDNENPLLMLAATLIELHAALDKSDTAGEASEAWYTEGPILHGPARWYEGSAALLMAAFGKKIVPNVDEQTTGATAQLALQIARVFMSEPLNSPVQSAMETLALVAWRRQQQAQGAAEGGE